MSCPPPLRSRTTDSLLSGRLTGLVSIFPCRGTLLSKIVVPAGPMGRLRSGSGETTPVCL